MNTRLEITYRGMDASESTDFIVREQLEKLERHCPDLQSCRVVVTSPSKGTKGGHFKVCVDLTLPGHEFVANRDPAMSHVHEDCHAAVRHVFRSALREIDRAHSLAVRPKRHSR